MNAADIQSNFVNPPLKYRMLQIIHNFPEGAASLGEDQLSWTPEKHTIPTIPQLVEFLEAQGYGGVVANVSFNNYLRSESAWTTFLEGMKACQRKGLNLWLYDEKGYPSGKAGGLTLEGHPEYECLGVVCAHTEGSGTLEINFELTERLVGSPLLVMAVPKIDDSLITTESVNLTDSWTDGHHPFTWQTPDQRSWVLMGFHVKRMYEGTHVVTNLSDPLPYIDIMNPKAVERFIELTHQAYHDRCGAELWKDILAIFTDEPSLMIAYLKDDPGILPVVPWSLGLDKLYKEKTGFDLIMDLPALFFDWGAATPYIRVRFWELIAHLIAENYYGQIQSWCHHHGIASTGHGLIEETLYHHVFFEGDHFQNLRRMDIPGIDNLSSNPTELARTQQIPVPKFVSSVTHLIGATNCMSETSSHIQRVTNQPCSFAQRLATINWMFVQGLTQVTSYYQFDEFKDSERKIFNDHIGRLGWMLEGGRHIAATALFYPVRSFWGVATPTSKLAWAPPEGEHGNRINRTFGLVSQQLLAHQLDYDFIDEQAILDAVITPRGLEIANECFCCIVLPETSILPLSVYQKLEQFITSGGSLVAVGNLPELGRTEEETSKVQEISSRLRQSERVVICRAEQTPEKIAMLIWRDVTLEPACPDLFYLHRSMENREVYFFSYHVETTQNLKVTLATKGQAELWHPTHGTVQPLPSEKSEKGICLDLHFEPLEGYLVVIRG